MDDLRVRVSLRVRCVGLESSHANACIAFCTRRVHGLNQSSSSSVGSKFARLGVGMMVLVCFCCAALPSHIIFIVAGVQSAES